MGEALLEHFLGPANRRYQGGELGRRTSAKHQGVGREGGRGIGIVNIVNREIGDRGTGSR